MLLSSWTPELIASTLSVLTEEEHELLEHSIKFSSRVPGITGLRQFGFKTRDEYEAAVAAVRQKALEAFLDVGIYSIDDLSFGS